MFMMRFHMLGFRCFHACTFKVLVTKLICNHDMYPFYCQPFRACTNNTYMYTLAFQKEIILCPLFLYFSYYNIYIYLVYLYFFFIQNETYIWLRCCSIDNWNLVTLRSVKLEYS